MGKVTLTFSVQIVSTDFNLKLVLVMPQIGCSSLMIHDSCLKFPSPLPNTGTIQYVHVASCCNVVQYIYIYIIIYIYSIYIYIIYSYIYIYNAVLFGAPFELSEHASNQREEHVLDG